MLGFFDQLLATPRPADLRAPVATAGFAKLIFPSLRRAQIGSTGGDRRAPDHRPARRCFALRGTVLQKGASGRNLGLTGACI
jgi:hypothetical protein